MIVQMTERFKTELLAKLADLDEETINRISIAADEMLSRYEVTEKVTDLVRTEWSIPQLCVYYIAARKIDGLSKSTLRMYYQVLHRFFASVRKEPVDVDANDIRMFLHSLGDVSNRSLNCYLTVVRTFFEWATNECYIERNPAKTIHKIKYQFKERVALDQDQLEIIRRSCKTKRESAIIELMYSTGCRLSEVAEFMISDVNWKDRTILVRHGKGDKQRIVYLNSKAYITLKDYVAGRRISGGAIFVSDRAPHNPIGSAGISKIIRGISKRSGVKFVPHQMRHTTATQMIRNGCPIEIVSKVLGNSNIQTTMIYTHMDFDKIKEEHARCIV